MTTHDTKVRLSDKQGWYDHKWSEPPVIGQSVLIDGKHYKVRAMADNPAYGPYAVVVVVVDLEKMPIVNTKPFDFKKG